MTSKSPDFAELNALAIEACDMWQDHLSTLASDPVARSELTRFLEPQRRLFADWVAMMQQGAAPTPKNNSAGERHDNRHQRTETTAGNAATSSAASPGTEPSATVSTPRGDADGDDALRVAQLAYRVAELEKRLIQLESLITANTGSSRRSQR